MKKCKIPYEPHDYCGICPYFKNIIYCGDFSDFEHEELIEECFCNYFIWPVRLTKEEYDNIPEWCPLDDYYG